MPTTCTIRVLKTEKTAGATERGGISCNEEEEEDVATDRKTEKVPMVR